MTSPKPPTPSTFPFWATSCRLRIRPSGRLRMEMPMLSLRRAVWAQKVAGRVARSRLENASLIFEGEEVVKMMDFCNFPGSILEPARQLASLKGTPGQPLPPPTQKARYALAQTVMDEARRLGVGRSGL